MSRKPEIQYVNEYYVHGSEARVLEFKPKRREIKTVLPKVAPDKTISIRVDPVALCGWVVVTAMLVMMIAGIVQFAQTRNQLQMASNHVISLQNENVRLSQKYRAGYNLEEIEAAAVSLGMIPKEEAEVVYFTPVLPVREAEPTVWENIMWFVDGLFA